MDPVQRPVDSGSCLVEVHRRGITKQLGDHRQEQPQAASCLGHHGLDGPHRDRDVKHVGEDLAQAIVRDVLVDRKVDGQGPDARAVAGGGGGRAPWSRTRIDNAA
jgi:hypothetical protein